MGGSRGGSEPLAQLTFEGRARGVGGGFVQSRAFNTQQDLLVKNMSRVYDMPMLPSTCAHASHEYSKLSRENSCSLRSPNRARDICKGGCLGDAPAKRIRETAGKISTLAVHRHAETCGGC